MAPFPLPVFELLGKPGAYVLFFAIGFAFGYILEISGFTESPLLAKQFYFKDFQVLKVMFGAIIVAMTLVFLTSQLGLLDYNLVWVNPTYLWPGILGGFIMGIGFILGGFCPGTSLVSAVVGRIDGIFFALGVMFGIGLFGELEPFFREFWYDSYYGRLTLPEVFHTTPGVITLLVVLMALVAFWLGEKAEAHFGKKDPSKEPRWRWVAGLVLVVLAGGLALTAPRTPQEKWERAAPQMQPLLEQRAVYVHPGELLDILHNDKLKPILIDVRSERDYNLFHIRGAKHVPLDRIPEIVPWLLDETNQPNVVIFVISNDERDATEAWKMLVAESVPNVYILEGGINHWLEYFHKEDEGRIRPLEGDFPPETLRWSFAYALGDQYHAAFPNAHEYDIPYTPKVKLKLKRGPTGGGCG